MTSVATRTHRGTAEVVSALSSLVRTTRTIARQRNDQLGASGTPLALLKALSRGEGRQRPGDLAQLTSVAPSVVSRALTRLEDDGLVERRPDEQDARACHVALTEAGRIQLAAIQGEYAALLDDALEEFSDDDVARLPGLLTALEHALGRAAERAATRRHTGLAPSLSTAPFRTHESR